MTSDAWPRDEAEFEKLFLAHHDAVYRLAFRIVGTRAEAEDLTQEAFLRLHQQILAGKRENRMTMAVESPDGSRAGGGHNLGAWLGRVVTRLALNALRTQERRERRHEAAIRQENLMGDSTADPAEAAVRSEERETVRRALAALPPRQSHLLLLRYTGSSYQELAGAIGVAPGSVGTLLARAEAAFAVAYRSAMETPRRGESHATRAGHGV